MSQSPLDANALRALERERLQALVDANLSRASELHAGDFQLINPIGRTYTKAEYMGDIASGEINYHSWQPAGEIAVLLHAESAVVRYEAEMEITVGERLVRLQRLWHTDVYELRDTGWQVVWSQATRISEPNA